MILENGIRLENIYYMLAYAFRALDEGVYADVHGEEFANAEDLFGEILSLGMSSLLKRGLHREYQEVCEDIPGLRGRIDMTGTLRHKLARRARLSCKHDEFLSNNIFNQILKTTAAMLVRSGKLEKSKYKLKRAVLFFEDVDEVDAQRIRWDALRYQKTNRHYLMLVNICRFVIDGMLMSDEFTGGNKRIRHIEFDERKVSKLYENFICAYYARHYNLGARAKEIDWALDEESDSHNLGQLPSMRSDVTLTHGNRKLIIDAKFYKTAMQRYWSHTSVNSGNFYQIYAYVTNEQHNEPSSKVSGMLLYAKTNEEVLPDMKVTIAGHDLAARTLNLACPFKEIAVQLDSIAEAYFGKLEKLP